jgi:hypothetical protein
MATDNAPASARPVPIISVRRIAIPPRRLSAPAWNCAAPRPLDGRVITPQACLPRVDRRISRNSDLAAAP